LPPVIVGDDHEVGRYVGGTQSDDQQIVSTAPNQLHALEFIGTHYGEETLLICKIRLFADYPETPTYLALTGYLRGEAPTAQPRLLPEEIE
jgi:hypothetical protein